MLKGVENVLLDDLVAKDSLKTSYRDLRLTDDEFSTIVTILRKTLIQSKQIKIPQLKKLITNFSKFREILTV